MSKEKLTNREMTYYRNFIIDLKNETDRAVGIIGAAKLDLLLYQIIQKFLLPCSSGRDDLLDGESPLGTFSAKINFAQRTGLISSDFAWGLNIIRRIRNSFAHELSNLSLESGAHLDRIKELEGSFAQSDIIDTFIKAFFNKNETYRNIFISIIAIMSVRLELVFLNMSKLSDKDAMDIAPPQVDNND